MLEEDNVRTGFFEPEQYGSVKPHLPDDLHDVMTFGHITGWRIHSEVLTLEWRQIDFDAGEVRLEPGTTKNKKGRTFPFTATLRTLLKYRYAEHEKLVALEQSDASRRFSRANSSSCRTCIRIAISMP